jgi:hypothetical protein
MVLRCLDWRINQVRRAALVIKGRSDKRPPILVLRTFFSGGLVYDDLHPTPVLTIPFEERADGEKFNAIFTDRGINQLSLRQLDSIGLVKFTSPFVAENFRFYTSRAVHLRYRDQVGRFQLASAEKRPGY